MDNSLTADHSWIDNLPETGYRGLPRFLIELGTVLRGVDGARIWAQSQWANQGNPRQAARELVPIAEQSEEGRKLVAAWRAYAEKTKEPADIGEPLDVVVTVLRSAREKATAAGDLELAAVFMEAQEFYVSIEAQNARDPHNPYKTRSLHHPLTTAVITLARQYVEPTREELAEVFEDLDAPEVAEHLRRD